MATDKGTVDKVLEQLAPLDVSARAMFGEYGLYFQGKFFGVICDDIFFVRVTDAGKQVAGKIGLGTPYPGAKPAFKISATKLRDSDWVQELVKVTAAELPLPKKKSKLKKSVS